MFFFFGNPRPDLSLKVSHSDPLDPATIADLCAGVDELCRQLSGFASNGEDAVLRARVGEVRRGSFVLGFVLVSLNGLAASNPAAFALTTGVLSSAVWKLMEYVGKELASKSKPALADKLLAELDNPALQAALRKVMATHKDGAVEAIAIETKELPQLVLTREDLAGAEFALSFSESDPRSQRGETLWSKHARIIRVADAVPGAAEWKIWFDWGGREIEAWVKAPPVPDALNWAPQEHRTIVADIRVTTEDIPVGKSGATRPLLTVQILRMLWGETQAAAQP